VNDASTCTPFLSCNGATHWVGLSAEWSRLALGSGKACWRAFRLIQTRQGIREAQWYALLMLNCPSCGGPLDTVTEEKEWHCPSCDTTVWLDEGDYVWRPSEAEIAAMASRVDTGPPPRPVTATADRTSGVLQVTCPVCEHVHDFSDWSEMFIFICDGCGTPVEVKEPNQ
jgi:hypothetical protein